MPASGPGSIRLPPQFDRIDPAHPFREVAGVCVVCVHVCVFGDKVTRLLHNAGSRSG